ncbi:hypothetical protein [Streptomyces sp. Ag109_O5-10]|uniref:hypothetical protein n=1 Tax=Streptomyces sp. Ag109_O5-10 TaxID=1855349 RepID=UPI00089CE866|nr:hypothetical protein [Streptomyces sp. Ag109_O5-10]SED58439.1 hypothetical protein SAMN05216533_0022 [Streptomyces sp. Ag109_O5-10]
MPSQVYQVSVPARLSNGRQGVHVFTGHADCPADAVHAAHKAYDAAATARQAGPPRRTRRPSGWTATGIRPDWQLDWSDATACLWKHSKHGEH